MGNGKKRRRPEKSAGSSHRTTPAPRIHGSKEEVTDPQNKRELNARLTGATERQKQRELKIGTYALVGSGIALGIFVGADGIVFALIVGVLSIVSYYVYTMPTRNSTLLWIIKLTANVILNIFLIPLLVMSWTMRPYRKFMEKREGRKHLKQDTGSARN
jgi:hypothetical protein